MLSPSSGSFAQQSGAKSVLIAILNWNAPHETLAAVQSVLQMDYPNFGVAIIDNGSTDNSLELLKQIEDARVELIQSPENLGFTGGCNLGFERALQNGMDYVWLLNSDAVTEVGTLTSLVRAAEEDAKIGMVSPLIASLQRPSIFIYANGYFDAQTPSIKMTRDLGVASKWAIDHTSEILLLGTALLVKAELIRTIGMLDPGFFAYWEDTDFCVRSNQAGFRNSVDFASTVSHSEKFPTDRLEDIKPHFWYYNARNEIRFWKKHARLFSRMKPLWWAYSLALEHLNALNSVESSKQAVLAGMWDGWVNRTSPYRSDARMPRWMAMIIEAHAQNRQKKAK